MRTRARIRYCDPRHIIRIDSVVGARRVHPRFSAREPVRLYDHPLVHERSN